MCRSLFILSALVLGVLSDEPKCKLSDKPCTNKVVNAFYKMLYAAEGNKLDPMHEDLIEVKTANLNLNLKQSTVTGLKDCNVDSANLGVENNSFDALLSCPGVSWTGSYDIQGELKSKHVEGSGDYSISTKLYRLNYHSDISILAENGNNYLRMNNFKVTGEPIDHVEFEFKNLYKGNKDLADEFHKFVSENSKEIWVELQDEFLSAAFEHIRVDSNILFNKEPLNKYIEM